MLTLPTEIIAVSFDNHLKYASAISGQNSVSERKSTRHVELQLSYISLWSVT
jgi:hypothetical protein